VLVSIDISAMPVPYDIQVIKTKGDVRVYNRNSKFKKALREFIINAFSGEPIPSGGAISLKLYILYPKKTRVTYKPDLSNMLKTIEDAATGVLYADDCQICKEVLIKKQGTLSHWKFRAVYESWDHNEEEWPQDLV